MTTEEDAHIYVECECGAETLHVERDSEELYFSLLLFSGFNLTWRQRLHIAWAGLRGKQEPTCVIVHTSRMPAFIRALETMLEDK